jgi:hypothetical protein
MALFPPTTWVKTCSASFAKINKALYKLAAPIGFEEFITGIEKLLKTGKKKNFPRFSSQSSSMTLRRGRSFRPLSIGIGPKRISEQILSRPAKWRYMS